MAQKPLQIVNGIATEVEGSTTSAGAGDAGKIPALGGDGRLHESMMPAGIGADVEVITASEDLSAGNYVNIHDDSGAKVRKADASALATRADGFVKDAVTNGQPATVYFEGRNDDLSGLTPGTLYWLSETAGGVTDTAPTTSGAIVQPLGKAVSATAINTEIGDPMVRA